MGEFSPIHWLILLGIFFLFVFGVPWLVYRHGRKVGDQQGYVRGYKEGQSIEVMKERSGSPTPTSSESGAVVCIQAAQRELSRRFW